MVLHAWQLDGCWSELIRVGGGNELFLLHKSLKDKKGRGITCLGDCRGKTQGLQSSFDKPSSNI